MASTVSPVLNIAAAKAGAASAGEGAFRFGRATSLAVELENLDDAALREEARSVSVYARVAPEHKLRIIDALWGRRQHRRDDR